MGVTGGEMRMMLRYEVKRTWRSPLPWLLLCAAAAIWVAALVLAGEEGTGRWQASALVQHRHLVGYLPVFLTLLSAYLVWETQRDRRSATEQVFLAWPVASWRWALVRTLALGSVTMASWLVLTALQAAYALYSYAGVAGLAGGLGAGQMLGDIGIMATDLLASLLGAQATAQVVAAVVPGIGGLVLVILYRLFILVGPGMVMGTFQWPYILLVTPELGSPWPQRWWPYSGAFGLAPYESLFWAHRALWIGGSTAALVCLAVLYRKGRDQPAVRSPLWASAALAAVILCAAPFVAEGKAVKDAFSWVVAEFGEETKPQMVVDENGHVRSGRPWEEVDVSAGPDDPLPVRYEIEADLTQGPEGRFHVQMEVELRAPAAEMPLTLRRVFQVESVAVDGTAVPMEAVVRSGDLLRIPLGLERESGQRVTVALTYSGRIQDWRLNDWPELAAAAQKNMLLVPATWGWYPVPGEFTLTYESPMTSLVYRYIADRGRTFFAEPAYFDVTLRAPAGIRSVAGFVPVDEPGVAGSRWRLEGMRRQVSLVGGNWWAIERDNITYLVPREYLDTWEEATQNLHALLQIAMDWTGAGELTVVPAAENVTDSEIVKAGSCSLVTQTVPDRSPPYGCLGGILDVPRLPRDEMEPSVSLAENRFFEWIVPYVEWRIMDEYGMGDPFHRWEQLPDEVVSWAQTTPVSEQKRQIRALLAAARTRPLTLADFAFLQGSDGP